MAIRVTEPCFQVALAGDEIWGDILFGGQNQQRMLCAEDFFMHAGQLVGGPLCKGMYHRYTLFLLIIDAKKNSLIFKYHANYAEKF